MIRLLSLAPALDLEADLRPPHSGKIGFLDSFFWSAGGKAVNLARFLRAWGVPFDLTLGVGGGTDPTHLLYRSLLTGEGLRASYLDHESPVRVNLVTREGTRASKYNHPGHPLHPAALKALGRMTLRFRRGDLWVLTGRVPTGAALSESVRTVRTLERRGVRCVVDASGGTLARFFVARPSFFKVNLFEISAALGKTFRSLENLFPVLPFLHRKGLAHGAVTDGDKGSLAWDGPEVVRAAAPRIGGVRSPVVGAGDAYLAGYLKAWREGKSLSDRVRCAGASGAVVARHGIAGFTSGRVLRRLPQVRFQ